MNLFEIEFSLVVVGLVIWVWSIDRVVYAMARVMIDDWKKEPPNGK